jgi:acetolactate synthase I/II/III large subunit
MGFGYPAALGAKVACPDRQVIDIDGDGSFLMNVQELATAHIENIAAKAIILNNQHLGMVVQWEDRFYAGNRGHTYLGDPRTCGRSTPISSPWPKASTSRPSGSCSGATCAPPSSEMLNTNEPYVLDVPRSRRSTPSMCCRSSPAVGQIRRCWR